MFARTDKTRHFTPKKQKQKTLFANYELRPTSQQLLCSSSSTPHPHPCVICAQWTFTHKIPLLLQRLGERCHRYYTLNKGRSPTTNNTTIHRPLRNGSEKPRRWSSLPFPTTESTPLLRLKLVTDKVEDQGHQPETWKRKSRPRRRLPSPTNP